MAALSGEPSSNGSQDSPLNGVQGGGASALPPMDDPFLSPQVNTAGHREPHRYSAFDSQLFTLNASSPAQAKRALEAHMEETERRLEEASRLGTALINQQQELSDKLKEVEQQQDEGELGEELRRKLVDLEREYNEIGRETARAFLGPKRLSSTGDESNLNTPSIDPKSPVNQVLFSGHATNSPSKMTVPSRKQRNQPSSRVHDIEFATEISTSLLAQVRQLQTLLAEREESLKTTNLEKSRLELEVEGYAHRVRLLDESEQRYKDENWALETQTHELMAAVREAAERESKLNNNLSSVTTEKSSVVRELDDLKQANAKLVDDQVAAQKANDAEIHLLRRNLNSGDAEKLSLQRKLEEVTSQNQELAKAVAAAIRQQQRDAAASREGSHRDTANVQDHSTPENSPPSSPTKPTPRLNHLESETLRSSLGHAHRMIQSLKSTIHREKTEKIELKRVLQESRDEVEQRRRDSVGGAATNKRQKTKSEALKKPPRPDLLGAGRKGKAEVELQDADWEDSSPTHSAKSKSPKIQKRASPPDQSSEAYQTATEDAFDTANENGTATESEAIQTGMESMADDSSNGSETEGLTETESAYQRTPSRRPPSSLRFAKPRERQSMDSTASDDNGDVSPTQTPRRRLGMKRSGPLRRIRPSGEAPFAFRSRPSSARDSPATSFEQERPATEGQSLFAELAEVDSPEGEEDFGPPLRDDATSRTSTPRMMASDSRRTSEAVSILPQKPAMVDAGMMTDTTTLTDGTRSLDGSTVRSASLPTEAVERGVSTPPIPERGVSPVYSQHTEPAEANPQQPELDVSPISSIRTEPESAVPLALELSLVKSEDTEPEQAVPVEFKLSSLQSEHTEPESAAPLDLTISSTKSQETQPTPAAPVDLAFSSVCAESTQPVGAMPLQLGVSSVNTEVTEPQNAEPVDLELSSISSVCTAPATPIVTESKPPSPVELTISPMNSEYTEPVVAMPAEPTRSIPGELPASPASSEREIPAELVVSSVVSEHTEPVVPKLPESESAAPAELAVSSVSSEYTEPCVPTVPEPEHAELAISTVCAEQHTEPVRAKIPEPAEISVSSVSSEYTEPVRAKIPEPAEISVSSVSSEYTEPVRAKTPEPAEIAVSSVSSEYTEPVAVKIPEPEHPQLAVSSISSEITEPTIPKLPEPERVELEFSSVYAQDTLPAMARLPQSELTVSPVDSAWTEPSPPQVREEPARPVSELSQSAVHSVETVPVKSVPRSGAAAAAALSTSRDGSTSTEELETAARDVRTSNVPIVNVSQGDDFGKGVTNEKQDGKDGLPRGSVAGVAVPRQPSQKSMSSMVDQRSDQGAQTILSSKQIDQILMERTPAQPPLSPDTEQATDTAGLSTPKTRPLEPLTTTISNRSAGLRPGSPTSQASTATGQRTVPDEDEKRAAEQPSISTAQMGPPIAPASALRASTQQRPRTPNDHASQTASIRQPSSRVRTKQSSQLSHRSSVSSFASEIEERLNIQSNPTPSAYGYGGNTDPRMIQAITQTMIGEFLWKYTRKPVTGDMSKTRHRRYFWVHPYTRTLYWSVHDPQTAGKSELKAKSVHIEAIRVVSDENPYPPGLHCKSLEVVSPGRRVRLTATTSQRHETWFNALSYLLLRSSESETAEDNESNLPLEDIDEFNAGFLTNSHAPGRTSVSSLRSHSMRNVPKHRASSTISSSRTPGMSGDRDSASLNVPGQSSTANAPDRARHGSSSRLSSLITPGLRESVSSRFLRRPNEGSVYEQSIRDPGSLEDLRHNDRPDEDEDRLENVRACCDGKHDVSALSRSSRYSPRMSRNQPHQPHQHHHHHHHHH